jgi:hypothetical protein
MLARVRVTPLLLSVPPIALAHRLKRILLLIGSRDYGVGSARRTTAVGNPWPVADVLQDINCQILRHIQKITDIAVPASEAVGA